MRKLALSTLIPFLLVFVGFSATAQTITIDTPIEGDDIVNASEAATVTISGTSAGGALNGTVVDVTIGGVTESTTITGDDGPWTVDLDISGEADGPLTVSAVYDPSGTPVAATNNGYAITLDQTSPTATVTVSETSIYLGNLTQTVTVTYDESMDNGTSPAIGFDNSGNFTSNLDGAWSTTTFTDDTWTETFTHDGTTEEIASETVTVASSSGATDVAGNADIGDTSPSFIVDTQAPTATVTVSETSINLGNLTQTVTVTYDESMDNGTSPAIGFDNSGNFTSNLDGAWSTTTFTDDTWTETFTHDGTTEQFFSETVTVASSSGATDLEGNADIGDTSPSFVVDTQAPTATVTVSETSIYLGNLTQTVTVTYDESMDNGTSPAIGFDNSGNFTSNLDGAWSTTTFTDDTWTETFTHDGTTEEIASETVTVASSSGATDVAGNADIGDTSPSFIVDTQAPTATVTVSETSINLGNLTQTVTVTYDESMDNGTSPAIGFDNSGNFTSNLDGAWSTTTFTDDTWTETFTHDGTAEEVASETVTVASSSGATDIAGNDDVGDTSPSFLIDTQSPTATVTVGQATISPGGTLTQTVTVTYDESMDNGTSPAIGFDNSGNFTSNLDGAWSTTTFTDDTWTETFTHDGTTEQFFSETVTVASSSGATDLEGNADIGDTSPSFVVDTQAPTATVTVSETSIYLGNLTQTVTVTYDESMDNGTSPAIGFDNSGNFTSNLDGAWSTTTFTDDTWTETFTHDGTTEEIASETVTVASSSGATDVAGNADIGDTSPSFIVDTQVPTFTNATFYDTDQDGSVDEILLEFSEDIDEASVSDANFNIGGAGFGVVNFGVVSTPAANGVDLTDTDNFITLSVDLGTTDDQSVDYVQGTLADEAGNLAASNSFTTFDLAPPVLTDVQIEDTNNDGFIDRVVYVFSEVVSDADDNDTYVVAEVGTITLPDNQPASFLDGDISVSNDGTYGYVEIDNITGQATENTAIGSLNAAGVNGSWDDDQGQTSIGDGAENYIDVAAPVIINMVISTNSVAELTFSEGVWGNAGATNPVTTSNFTFDIDGGVVGETVVSVKTTAATESDDLVNVLVGNESTMKVFFSFTQPNAGGETLTMNTDGNIYDAAMNTATSIQFPPANQDVLIAPDIPNLTIARWLDEDGDGNIDAVEYTFNIPWDIDEGGSNDSNDPLDCMEIRNNGILVTQDNFDYDSETTNGFYAAGQFAKIYFDADQQPGTSIENLTLQYVTGVDDRIESQSTEDDAVPGDTPESYRDGAAPRFNAFTATILDTNADGNVDQIQIETEDHIDDSAINPAEFTYNGVAATGVANVDNTDKFFYLTVNGNGTAVEGDFVYTVGTLADTASNASNGGTILAANITDGAGPVILSALTEDTEATPDGLIDQITITFSENLANIYGDQTFFSVDEGGDNYPVISATPGASDEIILAITEGSYTGGPVGPLDTHITPDITITAGFGDDAEGALTPAQTFTNTSDGAAPYSTVDFQNTANGNATTDASPNLTGTVDDPNATVLVNVSTFTRTATNNGNGTWSFNNTGSAPSGFTLSALGDYEVTAIAVDPFGNTSTDVTTDELTLEGGANITAAMPAAICTSDGFVSLGQIRIQETQNNDFASGGTILLTLPEGFEFNTAQAPSFGGTTPDIDVTGTFIGTASLRLNITYFGATGIDDLQIDNLEVQATLGGQTSVALERTGGLASLLTTDTDYAVLTSNSATASIGSLDENVTGVTDITELSIVSGTAFSLDASDQIIADVVMPDDTVVNWYQNVYDGTPEFTGDIATQADLASAEGLHTYFISADNAICESDPFKFNLLVYSYSDNGTNNFTTRTFRSTDDPDTMVFSNPSNHTVSVTGSGIVANISESGTLKAVFDPSTVAEGTYNITYSVTNSIGETQTVVGSFTVEALSDLIQEFRRNSIADASPGEDFCEVDTLSFDADLAEVSSLASAYFFRFSYFKTSGPGPYTLSPVAFDQVAGANYPAAPTQNNGTAAPLPFPLTGHNPNLGWDLELPDLTPGASYDVYLEFNRIGDGARGQRRVFSFFVQPLPTVEIANFGNQCENDNTTYQLSRKVDGVEDFLTNGFDLEFDNLGTWQAVATYPDENINPFDLQISQGGPGPGSYRIIYETLPQGDGSCTNSDTLAFTLFPTPSEPFLNATHNLSWRGAPWSDTGDPLNGYDSYVMEFCSPSDISFIVGENSTIRYNWYDDSFNLLQANQWFISAAVAFDDPSTGGVTEVPTAGTTTELYFATFQNGCESALKKITVYIYEDSEVPVPTPASLAAHGELESANYYIYDYCDDYDVTNSPIILEAANVGPSNPTSRNPSAYFNLYSEDGVLQTINFTGTDLTSAVLGIPSTGNVDTTIFVSQVWNDQTPGTAGTVAQPFEGCESDLVRFDINVTATPVQPLASDFVGINSTIIHICQNDAVSNITTSDPDDPRVDQYVWYDNNGAGGIGAEMVRRINGGSISQATIEANSSFDPAVVGQYSFFVTKISGLNSATSFVGCETATTEFIIEVHPIDDTDFPVISSADYSDIGDGEYDLDTDADHLFPVCITELDPLATLDVTSGYAFNKEFVWYQSNSTFATQTELLTASNPTFDQLNMGIGDISGAQSKYFIVTQRIDPEDFPAGQGCESGLATTYLEVRFSDLSALTMDVTNGSTADWCYDDINPTFNLLVGGSSVSSLPHPLGGNQDPNVQLSYAVLLNNNVLSDTLDLDPTAGETLVFGNGNITTDFLNWHAAKSGNIPDGNGNIVGGLASTHYILMQYIDPATSCVGREIFTLTIHPDPNVSLLINGNNADDQEFCYDDLTFDIFGYDVANGVVINSLTGTGSFSSNVAGGLQNVGNNEAEFTPKSAHDAFHGGASLITPFASPSAHRITYSFSDAEGCQRDTSLVVRVNPIPQIVDNEIKSASTCAETDIKLFVEMAPNNLGQGKDAYNFIWRVGTTEVQDLDGTLGGDTLIYNLGTLNSAQFSVDVTYIGDGNPNDYTTMCQSSIIGQTITVGEAPSPSIVWVGTTTGNPNGTDFRITEDNSGLPDGDVNYVEFFVNGVSQFVNTTPTFPINYNYNPGSPGYSFGTAGNYPVRVLMRTTAGCEVDSEIENGVRNIEIIDHLSGLTSYTESFESGAGGWTIETLSLDGKDNSLLTSWEIGTNVPDSVSGSTFDGSNAIYTNGYQPSEQSFVYSPSFDLSAFTAPTISFLRFEEFETFRDGVVLQMSTDDGRTWANVGSFDDSQPQGLKSTPNWYNREAITSAPGTVSPGPLSTANNGQGIGWALDSDWKEAIAPLAIPAGEEGYVRFRFALSAQATPKTTDGFAFDLVQIYDREQVVLIEQFSSTLSANSKSINNAIDNAAIFNGNDVVRINYFTDFANSGTNLDVLNQRNTSAPGAKSSFYGIENIPSMAIAGEAERITNVTQLSGSISAQLTNAKLVNPGFEIAINASIDSENNLNVGANFTAISDIPNASTKLGLFIAIVEPQIIIDGTNIQPIGLYQVDDTITNVLRKMLPSAAGQFEQGAIAVNDVLSIENITWPVSNMYVMDTLTVVAYVQNLATKQVLQSSILGLSNPNTELALGVDELADFSLYPNPADKQVTVEFADGITQDAEWVIYDQAGREVLKGDVVKGTRTMTVRTSEMPSGMYFIHLYAEDRKRQAKRIMIIH